MAGAALVLAIIALVLAVVALALALEVYRSHRARLAMPPTRAPRTMASTAPTGEHGEPRETGPAAFIINPAKVSDVAHLEEVVRTTSRELGLPDPLFFQTTVEDPGLGQAEAAIAAGASVVVAAGGDGTVRAVAQALVGTTTPMALLPSGTGNLLARNLDLPLDGLPSLVQTALSGREMAIDVAYMRVVPPTRSQLARRERGDDRDASDDPDARDDDALRPATHDDAGSLSAPEGVEHLFLVMAGTGFDAATMADTDEQLKKRIGWFAYLLRAVRHLGARRTRLAMKVGNGSWRTHRVRTLLVANCGRLPGGILLLPDAELDDGYLDIAAVDTRGWLLGWVSLFGRVMLQGIGWRRTLPYDAASIEFMRGRTAAIVLDQPEQVQIDGDVVGEASELHVRMLAGGLVVRVRR